MPLPAAQPGLVGLTPDREAVEWMLRRAITHIGGRSSSRTSAHSSVGRRITVPRWQATRHRPWKPPRCFSGAAMAAAQPYAARIRTRMKSPASRRRQPAMTAFCCLPGNGHLFPGQIALGTGHCMPWGKPMMAAALRNPYDLPLLPDIGKIAVYDYSPAALRALIAALDSGHFYGRLPVHLEESV